MLCVSKLEELHKPSSTRLAVTISLPAILNARLSALDDAATERGHTSVVGILPPSHVPGRHAMHSVHLPE